MGFIGFCGFRGRKLRILIAFALLAISSVPMFAQGNLSRNRYDPNSTANPYGAGNPYDPNSINNPYGRYGSKYSPDSANNPYATNAPRLYDADGKYRGRLSTNPYDPDSTTILRRLRPISLRRSLLINRAFPPL